MKKDFQKWHNKKLVINKQKRHSSLSCFFFYPQTVYYSEHCIRFSVRGFLHITESVNAHVFEKTHYLKYYKKD